MALVEIARFLDATEAQVVASALRSGDIYVLVQGETLALMDANLINAMGGLRLWVPEADAEAARAFIGANRARPSTLDPLPAGEAAGRTVMSLLLTLLTGSIVPLRPKRPERLGDGRLGE